ncbi:MAG: alpha/beta fold hydrolase [Chlamydiota bacterium]
MLIILTFLCLFTLAVVSFINGLTALAIIFSWVALGVFFKGVTTFFLTKGSIANVLKTLQVVLLEPLALIGVYSLSFLSFFSNGPFWAKKKRTPILMVHGYINFASVWFFHRRRLLKMGYGPIYTINLGYPFHGIDTYARKLHKKIKKIARQTKRNDIILIGHSMGGLVSSQYFLKYAEKGTVKAIITLGSPLKGTKVAKLGVGKCARQMRENSSFIKNLKDNLPEKVFYNVVTKKDQLVIPYRSGLITGDRAKRYVLDDIGHASLLYSTRVSKKLGRWLRDIVT